MLRHLSLIATLLLFGYGAEAPRLKEPPPTVDSITSVTPTPVTPLTPTAPQDSVAPPKAVTLAEVITTFEIEDPTGIRFRNCYFTQLPFPKKSWGPATIDTEKPKLITAPGTANQFVIEEDILFVTEMYPGKFLIAEEYDQFYHYVELTLVDEQLNVLWGPTDVNCDSGEYGGGILYTAFTSPTTLETLQEDEVSFSGDSTILYRKALTTTTLQEGGAYMEQLKNASYYRRKIEREVSPSEIVPEGQFEMSEEIPWIADSILPENAAGIVYLQEETPEAYRVTLRFPFYRDSLLLEILSTVHYDSFTNGEAYYQDVCFPITPISVTLFDTIGQSITLDTLTQLQYRFYCENDGPMTYNPSFDLVIPKDDLPRTLTPLLSDYYSSIVGAAVVNYQPLKMSTVEKELSLPGQLALRIFPPELSRPLVLIYTAEDEAEENYLCWYFAVMNNRRFREINCCGP